MRKNKHFSERAATEDTKIETQPAVEPASIVKDPPRPSASIGNAPLVATVIVPQDTMPVLTKEKAPARSKKGAGKKVAVATPVARPADSEATHPMATRQSASRAGGLRPGVGGSGQTDTCVASSHPSKT
jgi:hypothetical protein